MPTLIVAPPTIAGYAHERYAGSLSEFGRPQGLAGCGGWVLVRSVPGSEFYDAMGCYPLFACHDWRRLADDLGELTGRLASLVLVADPFGNFTPRLLEACFPDRVVAFKQHFVVDLSRSAATFVSAHHRRNVHKALQRVDVERCLAPRAHLDEWLGLYAELIERHQIQGIARFSPAAFAAQLAVPGLVAFRAISQSETVGMLLWYVQGEVAYYHLGAFSPAGYATGAAFALFQGALDYFAAQGLSWLDLGAGAGLSDDADGLTRFKQGWATGTRPAYLCGRILNPGQYIQAVACRTTATADYFPVYRAGEFQPSSAPGMN